MVTFLYCLIPILVLSLFVLGVALFVNRWSDIELDDQVNTSSHSNEEINKLNKELEDIKLKLSKLKGQVTTDNAIIDRLTIVEGQINEFMSRPIEESFSTEDMQSLISEELSKLIEKEKEELSLWRQQFEEEKSSLFKKIGKNRKALIKGMKVEKDILFESSEKRMDLLFQNTATSFDDMKKKFEEKWINKVVSSTPLLSNFNAHHMFGMDEALLLSSDNILCFKEITSKGLIRESDILSLEQRHIENINWFVIKSNKKDSKTALLFLNTYNIQKYIISNDRKITDYTSRNIIKVMGARPNHRDVFYSFYPGWLRKSIDNNTGAVIWRLERPLELYYIPSVTEILFKNQTNL